MTDSRPVDPLDDLAERGRRAIRRALSRPTAACPDALGLVRYALARAGGRVPLNPALRAIGVHKAACGHCAGRYRLLRAALSAPPRVRLGLRKLLRASDERGRAVLAALGESLAQAIDARLRPRAVPVTLGPQTPTLKATVLDAAGRPVGELPFAVERGPEVHEGRFVLELRAEELAYEGRPVWVALALDPEAELWMELARVRVRGGRASVRCPLSALGLQFEPVIPLALVRVSVEGG